MNGYLDENDVSSILFINMPRVEEYSITLLNTEYLLDSAT